MNTRLDKALALLERLARAIARCPDELRMVLERSPGVVTVDFVANPCDTKRLVGTKGCIIRELSTVFRLMATGSGTAVKIGRMIPNMNPEREFEAVVGRNTMDLSGVLDLFRDVCEQVFELPTEVHVEPHTEWSVKMYAHVQGDLEGNTALEPFGKAVNIVFTPIGKNVGPNVFAHVYDWKHRKKARAAADR